MKKGFLKLIILLSFIGIVLLPKSAYALTFKVEKSVDTIKPGKDVTVYIKASDVGSDPISSYNISLSYDTSKLDFKSGDGNNVSTVNANNPIVITNSNGTLTDGTTVATLNFTAKSNASAGDANFSLSSSDCYAQSDTNKEKEIKATNTSSMVKIASLSSDATLSSLKIPNATISPKFDKNTTEYKTTIQDITEITVNAIASDSSANIMISDNYKALKKGDNEIKISVTAEDGKTTKVYVVKVILKLTPTSEELVKADATLKSLKITGYEIDFDSATKKYTLTVPYKTTKLTITAEAQNKKANIELQGNTNLKVGRNTIKILVTSEDKQNKETYTLNVTREKEVKKVVQTCPDTTSQREWIVFSVCMFLTFTLGIILGYYLSKKEVLKKIFKHRKKKEEEVEEELSNTKELTLDDKNKMNKR